ncbi:ABC transporter ATP-binding protein [bacterium]|nr:ABC transporter ATP-binding protein [bacterium]MBU1883068.1 ABC transporter ATP-binding protein [bacterium]
MQSKAPVLEIKALSFAYDREVVLEDISLRLEQGDLLAIIGPNGGGKSTLLKLILGINKLQKGIIKLEDHHIGYVPQNTNINIDFPIQVIEVVMMGRRGNKKTIFGYSKEEKLRAFSLLEKVNMAHFAEKKIGALSGGQRQRVMIARALYQDPELLILDEPTSSIDADGQREIYELLKQLNKTMSIIVVSHDLSILLEYANRVAYINKRVTHHDLSSVKKEYKFTDKHVCEVELLEMLGSCRC